MEVGILIFDGVEELDFAGPWEVLAAWAQHFPGDGVRVRLLAEQAGPVQAAKGMRVLPDATPADAGALDVVVVPGGQGTRALLGPGALHDWLRGLHEQGALVTSVCTGALVLGAAGLLRGLRATTHWGALDELRATDPSIDVVDDERFVDEGAIVTAAGVSAGIDMALHLVARLHSVERARAVRREIQYDPAPPV